MHHCDFISRLRASIYTLPPLLLHHSAKYTAFRLVLPPPLPPPEIVSATPGYTTCIISEYLMHRTTAPTLAAPACAAHRAKMPLPVPTSSTVLPANNSALSRIAEVGVRCWMSTATTTARSWDRGQDSCQVQFRTPH